MRFPYLANLHAITLAGGLLAFSETDPDLWGHLRFGLDILDSGWPTRVDPYSYLTQGSTWVNHEWLFELILGGAWRVGGVWGLNLFKAAVVLGLIAVLFFALRRDGWGPIAAGLLLLILTPTLSLGLKQHRPQVFTVVGVALVVATILSVERGQTRRAWLLPLLIAVWGNLHGGVLAGLGLIAVWWAAVLGETLVELLTTWQASFARLIQVTLVAIACGLAMVVHPWGWEYPQFLIHEGIGPRPEIADWQPLSLASGDLRFWSYPILVAGGIILLARCPQPTGWIRPSLFAALALAPLLAVRHLPLLVAGWVLLMPWGSIIRRDGWLANWENQTQQSLDQSSILWMTGPLILLGVILSQGGTIPHSSTRPLPIESVDLMRRAGVEANLAVDFDWGEYVIWHLGPNVKVSLDGRRETVYPPAIYWENLRFFHGARTWRRLIDRPETDLVLIPWVRPVGALMLSAAPGWVLIHEEAGGGLFARKGSELAQRLNQAKHDWTPPRPTNTFPDG
jgi:hypothetical protein